MARSSKPVQNPPRNARVALSSKVGESGRQQRRSLEVPPANLNRRTANIPPHVFAKHGIPTKSRGIAPVKHMRMQQALTEVPRLRRTVAQSWIESFKTFEDFGLLPSVQEGTVEEVLANPQAKPTAVQSLVIPRLTGRPESGEARRTVGEDGLESYLIAAETGSGKTLAYTIPVIENMKHQEQKKRKGSPLGEVFDPPALTADHELEIPAVNKEEKTARPRAIVLVPTTELVAQVGAIVKKFSHVVKFRSVLLSREISAGVLRNRFFGRPVDVVVSTPHLLNSLTEDNPALLSRCHQIVVDEADSLFDRSFSPVTTAIISRCNNLKQLILCSATIPKSLDKRLRDLYPDMRRLVTPNLHSVPRRVRLQIVDVESELYRGNRKLACADTLYKLANDNTEAGFMKKVIVFVNKRETTTEVASYLRSKGINAVDFARDVADRVETGMLQKFTGDKQHVPSHLEGTKRMEVLVTTDIASRGIDTKTVKNVVLYDKPHSSIDLIHRIGRTGRLGRRGTAIILVDKHTNRGWVKEVKTSMHAGSPLV